MSILYWLYKIAQHAIFIFIAVVANTIIFVHFLEQMDKRNIHLFKPLILKILLYIGLFVSVSLILYFPFIKLIDYLALSCLDNYLNKI
ncbi:MAG: hypothetical protein GX127_07140 [Eubacteriaceae bacterium]|nr:hypothetical protein [Eubacteriaceae bacterium]